MSLHSECLPTDVATLHTYIEDLHKQLDVERAYRNNLQTYCQEMHHAWHIFSAQLQIKLQERNQQLNAATHAIQQEISRHIADKNYAEQALAESEKRYQTLIETSPSAIILTDMDRTIRFCNQHAALLFGYANTDDLCGKKSTVLMSPTHLSADPLEYMQQIFASGNLYNMELIMQRQDGSLFPAEVNSAVVTDHHGLPKAVTVIVRDMTERKLAEYALMDSYDDLKLLNLHLTQSRNLLRALLDGIEDGLMLIDQHGTIQTVNKAMALLLDDTTESLVGQSWANIADYGTWVLDYDEPNDQGTCVSESFTLLARSPGRRRVRYTHLGGTTRILDIQTMVLHGDDQNVEQSIVHVIDVTQNVQLEARVIENERFAASGRLAATVAHEINTPLQSLQTFLKLALSTTSDDDRNTFLNYAREEIQRLVRIVRQLLELYRPSASVRGQVDVIALCERILILLGKQLRDKKISVERDFMPAMPPIWGRSDELMQVLLNLIVNAIDAMPKGGKLHLQVSADTHISIAIRDNGCGIQPDIQETIFEPFVTTKERGTGLGLAISTEIVKQHHGTILLESLPMVGSTFTLIFPIYTGINDT